MFTTKRWRQGTNYLISMVQPIKTNFILVLRKLLLKNLILSISNLSMTDTMKKTQIYQINFIVSKIATLPHQLLEKSNENTYLSTDKQTNAFCTHINLLNKKTKLTTKYRHQNCVMTPRIVTEVLLEGVFLDALLNVDVSHTLTDLTPKTN